MGREGLAVFKMDGWMGGSRGVGSIQDGWMGGWLGGWLGLGRQVGR